MKKLTRKADAYVELYLASHQLQDEPTIRIARKHSTDPAVVVASTAGTAPTDAFREASPLATGHTFELDAEAADAAARTTRDVTTLLLAMEKLTVGPTQARNQLALSKYHLVTGRVYERSKDPSLLHYIQPNHLQSQGMYGADNWTITFDSYCRTAVKVSWLPMIASSSRYMSYS